MEKKMGRGLETESSERRARAGNEAANWHREPGLNEWWVCLAR